jgi:nitrate reductase gamma subunit
MEIILALIVYFIYALFWGRLFMHALVWFRAAESYKFGGANVRGASWQVCILGLMDIVFFRRLFGENKLLWIGSWTFHVCFLLVVVRHLRFFMDPVPDCVVFLQPFGLVAGYVLPVSTVYLALLRLRGMRERYVSYQNYFVLGLVFAISVLGLVMRNFFFQDLTDVKEFALGILRFGPSAVPGGYMFIAHFSLVLLLIPYLPFHLFTAPCVTMEARRREAALAMVMHER